MVLNLKGIFIKYIVLNSIDIQGHCKLKKPRLGASKHRVSVRASHPAALGSILGVPKNLSLDAADIY